MAKTSKLFTAPRGTFTDEFRHGWDAGYQRAIQDVLERHPKLRGRL
jgi:hypothetical protein